MRVDYADVAHVVRDIGVAVFVVGVLSVQVHVQGKVRDVGTIMYGKA